MKSSIVPAAALLAEEAVLDKGRGPTGNRSQTGGPADMVRTLDGHVYIHVTGNPLFRRFCQMIGNESLLEDPRFATDDLRSENGAEMSLLLQDWAASKSTPEVLAACDAARLPAGEVLSPREVLDLEHLRQTGAFADLPYPGLRKDAPVLTTPFVLSACPGTVRTPAPEIGADTDDILGQLGLSGTDIRKLRARSII